MAELKYIENAAQFLLDSGLLFEINRTVLHKHGLAMQVEIDDNNNAVISNRLWDCREDTEGIVYANETIKDGTDKYNRYLKDSNADKRFKRREASLGYIIQEAK
jgi:hypothetical protein